MMRNRTGQTIVNPARAGMIPAPATGGTPIPGKPRASGDDPYYVRAEDVEIW